MRRSRVMSVVLAILVVAPFSGAAVAQNPTGAGTPSQAVGAYLGVAIEPLPPALAAQLPTAIPHGQGVLVAQVDPDSPASKAGIRPFDVLLTYDDQRLFSPEQLTKLVRSDKPGREVAMQGVHNGRVGTVTVTLGQRSEGMAMPQKPGPMPYPWQRNRPYPHHRMPFESQRGGEAWESFDSLSLKSLGDNRYKAEVEYLSKDGGRTRHLEFEGTRTELRDKIMHEKDMTAVEKRQLLGALDLDVEPFGPAFMPPFDMGPLFQAPWGWSPAL